MRRRERKTAPSGGSSGRGDLLGGDSNVRRGGGSSRAGNITRLRPRVYTVAHHHRLVAVEVRYVTTG
jgi:hypothetical protein